MSDRLRLDLVLNDFAACAMTSGEITVLSDGTPWRPLIDVADMARAIEWAATRDAARGGTVLTVNTGADRWNLRVRDLAEACALAFDGAKVSINPDAMPDRRSYAVDFSRFRELAPGHQPQVELDESIRRLGEGLRAIRFDTANFRDSGYSRLHVLAGLLARGALTADLRRPEPKTNR
jgi:nucleoside-diphosphate-sugar epimerase